MNVERNQSNTSLPKSSTSNEPAFPSDKELGEFQKLSNPYAVSNRDYLLTLWREFRKSSNSKNGIINKAVFLKVFNKFKVPDNLSEHLFKSKFNIGFGLRVYKVRGQVEHRTKKIELHDIMLALTLLSRIPSEKKIELIFDLTDVDEDGCLSPDDIYKMIEIIERIFAKENTEMKIQSRILLEDLSRDKAQRRYDWVMRSVGMLKSRSKNEEGLITFDEFQNVLNKVPILKAQFLPRYTDIKTVLRNENTEPVINVEDHMLEDFLIFRYELQALFADSLKSNRKRKLPLLQKSSKTGEKQWCGKECPGLINGGKHIKDLKHGSEYWELNSGVNQIMGKQLNPDKVTYTRTKIDKDLAISLMIPKRPVEEALQQIEKEHKTNQNYKNDEEESHGYETLISSVASQVADTKKKKNDIGEIQTITRKSDLRTLHEKRK